MGEIPIRKSSAGTIPKALAVNDVIVREKTIRKKILRESKGPERKLQVYKLVLISREFGITDKESFTNLKGAQSLGIRVIRVYEIKTHGGAIFLDVVCISITEKYSKVITYLSQKFTRLLMGGI